MITYEALDSTTISTKKFLGKIINTAKKRAAIPLFSWHLQAADNGHYPLEDMSGSRQANLTYALQCLTGKRPCSLVLVESSSSQASLVSRKNLTELSDVLDSYVRADDRFRGYSEGELMQNGLNGCLIDRLEEILIASFDELTVELFLDNLYVVMSHTIVALLANAPDHTQRLLRHLLEASRSCFVLGYEERKSGVVWYAITK